jgi:hypothetical protein
MALMFKPNASFDEAKFGSGADKLSQQSEATGTSKRRNTLRKAWQGCQLELMMIKWIAQSGSCLGSERLVHPT